MNSAIVPEDLRAEPLGRLKAAALGAVVAGGAGSLGLMFYVARRQPSILLMTLFTVWVVYPFVAFLCANVVSKEWPVLTRAALYVMMIVVSAGSLIIYGNVALQSRPAKAASMFLVVPPVSGLLTAIVVGIAALLSRRGREDS